MDNPQPKEPSVCARFVFEHKSEGRQKADREVKLRITEGFHDDLEKLRREYSWNSISALCKCILLAFMRYDQGTANGLERDLLNGIFGGRQYE